MTKRVLSGRRVAVWWRDGAAMFRCGPRYTGVTQTDLTLLAETNDAIGGKDIILNAFSRPWPTHVVTSTVGDRLAKRTYK